MAGEEASEEFTVSVAGSELIQTGTRIRKAGSKLDGADIAGVIARNVIKDGKDGVAEGSVSATYAELREPGRAIRVNDKAFRLTGETQQKDGVPSLEFTLQEAKK